jgi:putative N-acetylmannosamine-6-phosphate epimerase
MKKTLVRLQVRREVVRLLTHRDLTIAAGGGVDTPNGAATEQDSGCRRLVADPAVTK